MEVEKEANLKIIIDRINEININNEQVDSDVKTRLTIAFFRNWLEASKINVNEGVLFSLFNAFGHSFFDENLVFMVEEDELVIKRDDTRLFEFRDKQCNFYSRGKRDGYAKIDNIYNDSDINAAILFSFPVSQEGYDEMLFQFDKDGIECGRKVSHRLVSSVYTDEAGYSETVSYNRVGPFLERCLERVPVGSLVGCMKEQKDYLKMPVNSERLVDFIRLPELSNKDVDFGIRGKKVPRRKNYFKRLDLDKCIDGSHNYYMYFDEYASALNECKKNGEYNDWLKEFFPDLHKAAERRIDEIILNGVIWEQSATPPARK